MAKKEDCVTDLDLTGSCQFFDSKPFIDAANILVAADEPLRALKLLEGLPGFYRDNIPSEIHELKRRIKRDLATPTFYMEEKPSPRYADDNAVNDIPKLFGEYVTTLLRGQLIQKDVLEMNHSIPSILDLGPGEYWLPIGMKYLIGRLFSYKGVGLCNSNEAGARPFLDDLFPYLGKPNIFVACELIEHLHHEDDIRTEFERHAPDASIIHISTPKYSFDGRADQIQWENKKGLGHLRTYTPREFHNVVARMFPEFQWKLWDSQILHMRGER